MGTKRVGWARIQSLINENTNRLNIQRPKFTKGTESASLTLAQSGETIIWGPLSAGLAADTTFTLPTATDGLYYRFVYVGGAADAEKMILTTGSDTNFFIGGVVQHDPDNAGDDTVVFHPNNSSNSQFQLKTPDAGSWVEVWCDGTNWFLSGCLVSATDTGVVFADQ